MKNILAKLNNVINSLEEQGFVREANNLDKLFNDMAENSLNNPKMKQDKKPNKNKGFDPSMNVEKEFGASEGPAHRMPDLDVAPYAKKLSPPMIKIRKKVD